MYLYDCAQVLASAVVLCRWLTNKKLQNDGLEIHENNFTVK